LGSFHLLTVRPQDVVATPIAIDDDETIEGIVTTNFSVLDNDFDSDGDNFEITAITSGPSSGTATIINNNTQIQFIPAAFGVFYIRYQICEVDCETLCSEATLTVTVNPEGDYGDAPPSYGVMSYNINPIGDSGNPVGASFGATRLGSIVSGESGMYVPGTFPYGEAHSDDDGIVFVGGQDLRRGTTQSLTVSWISNDLGGHIYGWIDFNGDGTFQDPGERVVDNIEVGNATTNGSTGSVSVNYNIPSDAQLGTTYARFTIQSDPSERGPTGDFAATNNPSEDGEVEDYSVNIINNVEICGNGMDDDGDGLIDDIDPDCGYVNELDCSNNRYYIPPVWRTNGDNYNQPSRFFIYTAFPNAEITVRTSDGVAFNQNYSLTAGNLLEIPLDTSLMQTQTENLVESNRGFIVESDYPVQILYALTGALNNNLITVKGSEALGRAFRTGSQTNTVSPSNASKLEAHFISVMATEDNTTVTFNFSGSLEGITSPHQVTLNAEETYLIRDRLDNRTISGSLVTADKEITVVSGSQHTRASGTGSRDGGVDQLVPIDRVGQDYVVTKGGAVDQQEYAIIVAVENNTEVFIDGSSSPITSINAGQYYSYGLTGSLGDPHSIHTSKIAYVYQVSGLTTGEVGMAICSPVGSCRGSRCSTFPRIGSGFSHSMSVIIQNSGLSSLRLNGVLYNDPSYGNTAVPVPGLSGYSTVYFDDSDITNFNILTSDEYFFASLVNGLGASTGTFGYINSFAEKVNIIDPATDLPTTNYLVDTLCGDESILHCLMVESCGSNHQITNIINGDYTASATIVNDTCINYTPQSGYSGFDVLTVEVTNEFGVTGQVCLQFYICSGVPQFTSSPVDLTVDCDAIPSAPSPAVSDDCDQSIAVNFQEVRIDHPTANWRSSGTCDILYAVTDGVIDTKGTGTTSDDEISFTLSVIGQNIGVSWSTSINGTNISGSYYESFLLENIAYSGPTLNFNIVDSSNGSCTQSVSIDLSSFD